MVRMSSGFRSGEKPGKRSGENAGDDEECSHDWKGTQMRRDRTWISIQSARKILLFLCISYSVESFASGDFQPHLKYDFRRIELA